jgi:hypothetical protein
MCGRCGYVLFGVWGCQRVRSGQVDRNTSGGSKSEVPTLATPSSPTKSPLSGNEADGRKLMNWMEIDVGRRSEIVLGFSGPDLERACHRAD